MPCYTPLKGYKSNTPNENGKYPLTFSPREGYIHLDVPCGQCIGCRLERSRQWAIRCVHEAQLHENNCFITLTYNDENLPKCKTLQKRHYQLFMKRLRKEFKGIKIRYFHCGEYGEKFKRPHYHAILFGIDFEDKKIWKTTNEQRLYTSEKLDKIWKKGFTTIGNVTFESIAYVARYILKKINGKRHDEHYLNKETGEIIQSEYTTMSRRPGIGKEWFSKYTTDVYPSDFIVLREQKMRPPKYYDKLYETLNEPEYEKIKLERKRKAKLNTDNTPERLRTKKICKEQKLKQLIRGYENET